MSFLFEAQNGLSAIARSLLRAVPVWKTSRMSFYRGRETRVEYVRTSAKCAPLEGVKHKKNTRMELATCLIHDKSTLLHFWRDAATCAQRVLCMGSRVDSIAMYRTDAAIPQSLTELGLIACCAAS
jgi:hypothetical protein